MQQRTAILIALCCLAALAVQLACVEDETASAADDAGAPDTDTDVDSDTDSDTDSDSDADACNETFEDYIGQAFSAGAWETADGFAAEVNEAILGQGCGWSVVAHLELRDLEPGAVDLATQSQYASCDRCLLLGVNCAIANIGTCGTIFIATEGELGLMAVDPEQPWGNYFELAVSDVVLEESDINWSSGTSTLIGGDKVCIDLWHVTTTLDDWNW
jgi:hypothetical protein